MSQRNITPKDVFVITGASIVLASIPTTVIAHHREADPSNPTFANLATIETSLLMYSADYDSLRIARQLNDPAVCASWKQVTTPYRQTTNVFVDPVNESSRFYDSYSDPAVRSSMCVQSQFPLDQLGRYKRSYYLNNIFGLRESPFSNDPKLPKNFGRGYFDNSGPSYATIEQPANVGDLVEGRAAFGDSGPFSEGWTDNVDSQTAWMGAVAPVTGLTGSNLSGKFNGKGQVVAFMDGHVAAKTYASMCNTWIIPETGGVFAPNYKTFWNFSMAEVEALGPQDAWIGKAVKQYCTALPPANQ